MSAPTSPDELDRDRARTRAVFVSSSRCVDAVRDHLAESPSEFVRLAALRDGCGLSPRRDGRPLLDELILGREPPPGLRSIHRSMGVDPGFLLSVSRIVWFLDEADPIPPAWESGAWACAANVALGARMGLPVEFRDRTGRPVSSPIVGAYADLINDTLFEFERRRRERTRRAAETGLIVDLDPDDPMFADGTGAAFEASALALPLDLAWRLRRLELWCGSVGYDVDFPPEVLRERDVCVSLLRGVLGDGVRAAAD